MKLHASWITAPIDTGTAAVTFLRPLPCRRPVRKATLRITAVGLFTAAINGQRVGDEVFAPGWTSYRSRIQVRVYDITNLLLQEENTLSVTVGRGWGVGELAFRRPTRDKNYAERVMLIAECRLAYADGTTTTIGTNGDWDTATSPITFSEIYHGESVDATHVPTMLGKAVIARYPARLIATEGVPMREQERLAPIAVLTTPKGERVIDFGQNIAGYAELRLRGPRGGVIVVDHAEVLDKDGNFYTDNMRGARCRCEYTLSGGDDIFKPSFSFQGFRYIRLTEYPLDKVDAACFRAVAVHSDMERTGSFTCGNPLINQLYHNIIWGQKGNYLDVPTDCPQRDERLGWTGDTQVFCRTAALNFHVEAFFRKWLGDMIAEQRRDGAVNCYVPRVTEEYSYISAAWGDAACIVPYEMYLAYGNRRDLARAFPMMKKWVDYLHGAGPEEFLWLGGNHFGDWLAHDRENMPDTATYHGKTPTDLIASAYFAYSTILLIKAGEALGEDVTAYRLLYRRVREAFRARYIPDGELLLVPNGYKAGDVIPKDETQTAYALVLYFGLYEGEEERCRFADRLAALVRAYNTRLTTGFVGTPYLLHALSQNGYTTLAYDLLFTEKAPSWLYSVTHGATTMWEHWDGIREDGSFRNHNMNSFNHYAYGAVYDWIFGVGIGVTPCEEAVGYRAFRVAPHPDRRLGHAEASLKTAYGRIAVRWYYKGDAVLYEITVPPGTTAYLTLPSGYQETLTGGTYHFSE